MTANRTLTILFSLAFGIASSRTAQSDARFTKANQNYAQGHFPEAISSYEALVSAGQGSPNLFYDLGNAYFRTGDFATRSWNYDGRSPWSDIIRSHGQLQIARDEARRAELQQSWPSATCNSRV